MERTYLVSETYEIVTPESAEMGDFDETGFTFQDEPYTAREILEYMDREGFYIPSCSHYGKGIWFSTYPEQNYRDGSEESRSIHFELPERILKAICKQLKIKLIFSTCR